MKKAFTLVEMLCILMTLPVFMIAMSRLFNTLMKQTPRIWSNVQQNTTMIDMLSHLRGDIDKAKDLPQSKGPFVSNDKMFLIDQENTLISYEFDDTKVIRRTLSELQNNTNEEKIWLLPDIKIEWSIHRKDDKTCCLEITHYIENKQNGHLEKKMLKFHLYFMGAM